MDEYSSSIIEQPTINTIDKPAIKPRRAFFSCGPTAKHPGWHFDKLRAATISRSRRCAEAREKINRVICGIRETLEAPSDWKVAIVTGSNTGAFELALWNLLGPRRVTSVAFDAFGSLWLTDVVKRLKLPDAEVRSSDYGELPNLSSISNKNDIVFVWNGTSSGVRVPNADWIGADHEGLVFCDATSAAYAQDLSWDKLDVVTFSWQKVLGGEAGHGVVMLSPKAVSRAISYTPPWPVPALFGICKDGVLNEEIFESASINTISMMCLEDVLSALDWVKGIGGLSSMFERCNRNSAMVYRWAEASPWVAPVVSRSNIRSNTSVCLKFREDSINRLDPSAQLQHQKAVTRLLEHEAVAYDIDAHRSSPAGLRLWTGATVEEQDIAAMLPWIDWACAVTAIEGAQ